MVYALLRAKALSCKKVSSALDDAILTVESIDTIRAHVEEIRRALERFKLLRTEHSKATKAIGQAGRYADEASEGIVSDVMEVMAVIDRLVINDGRAAA